ncbi:MAG: tRNA (guanosine(37)-N1)-methyltransferase TrmD [Bacteroidales bacterium]|jgi:tRNA (guanine37-N1)-methyltransferase|nr:tRNA (guanosine(37)-N1)-methyltransferase TrmD [Bacteroidales bacterium]MDI9576469.1 tRNA (guanosine(37)-N1)-methyltransferase TrmD [Bacteroidota bacterium]MDD2594025.1 tRNA (guanosine(37)-N1)-methyltransferase TrmD [Bacteroidales bacterium]MDD3755828.1 tRNA (guanosine(37)-N1)-methyltransferase TrmD [Bacteroidales bacterium]MDY0401114.1 tRNA (guanosine(37)-N1)-methyltransferase TrmD [Bacteroidales bacterium]
MRIDILTVFPEMFIGPFDYSIIKRAKDKGLIDIYIHNLRDFSNDRHRRVDDYPYGGEAGMVLKVEPIANAIEFLNKQRSYDEIIFLTPDGTPFTQSIANKLSLMNNIILLCGHYKGIDERVRELFITMELSIGDYVLSGGELPAMVVVDAITRLLPGVLGDEQSALSDSFQDGLISPPVYTRPANFRGHKVPDILRSGDHNAIEEWKLQQSIKRTQIRENKKNNNEL